MWYVFVCRVLMQADNADPDLHFEPRGMITMKGRAEPMQVYFLSRAQNEEWVWGPPPVVQRSLSTMTRSSHESLTAQMRCSFYYNTLDIPTSILCITRSWKQRISGSRAEFYRCWKKRARLLVSKNFSKKFS